MATYDEQILGAKQQAEFARKLRESFKAPEGQMVSGWHVAPSATQYAAELMKAYYGRQGEDAANAKLADILKQKQAATEKWAAEMPQNTPERQVPTFESGTNQAIANALGGGNKQNPWEQDPSLLSSALRGEQQQQMPLPQQTGVQTIPAQQVTPEQQMAWLLRSPDQNASTLGAKMMEAQTARQDKRDLLQMTMQEKRDAQERQIEANRQQAQLIASLKPQQDPLVQVEGPDGKPIFMPRSQAAGQVAYTAKGAGTPQQRAQDANDAMKILQEAAPLVSKSTSSGIGTLYDSAMALFGKSTEGADVAAQMKVLGGALVSKMPKMSGPQSDKDVLLYKEMAGRIGDPTVPASQKAMAMKEIMRLQAYYGGTQELPMDFDGTAKKPFANIEKPNAPAGGARFLGFE